MNKIRTANAVPVVLMVDDDQTDVWFVKQAIEQAGIDVDFRSVEDGAYVIDFCNGEGRYSGEGPIRPDLILLDINMPLLDGLQTIGRIKADPELIDVPIVMLTTSNRQEDVVSAYTAGAASYATKPSTFEALKKLMEEMNSYWFDTVMLARDPRGPRAPDALTEQLLATRAER